MKIHLAPMEGVVDPLMRDILTRIGGIDRCVTEFIRVTDQLLPPHIFLKFAPELNHQSQTAAGTELYVQLLGGQAIPLGENAAVAVELGARGIDLNFGCPAKTVNRHDGGASLLKCPERLHTIISTVKAHVPKGTPVTAKIRLGFDSPDSALEIAQAAQSGGAHLLTVHARTKMDAYKPPARWEWIAKIKEVVTMPVMANGDIWNVDDYYRCREVTGCDDVMIGRGAIADPFLCHRIKASLMSQSVLAPTDIQVIHLVLELFDRSMVERSPVFAVARCKQWMRQLSKHSSQIDSLFHDSKRLVKPSEFRSKIQEKADDLSHDSEKPESIAVDLSS